LRGSPVATKGNLSRTGSAGTCKPSARDDDELSAAAGAELVEFSLVPFAKGRSKSTLKGKRLCPCPRRRCSPAGNLLRALMRENTVTAVATQQNATSRRSERRRDGGLSMPRMFWRPCYRVSVCRIFERVSSGSASRAHIKHCQFGTRSGWMQSR
jgi:hypothetical protein